MRNLNTIESAADLAASIYLIRNQDRAEGEWEPLPEGVTADHITRALCRQEVRRANTRRACDEYAHELSRPLPVPSQCAVDGCHQMTVNVVCNDCQDEIESGAFDHSPVPWSTVFWFCAAIIGASLAVIFLAGGK